MKSGYGVLLASVVALVGLGMPPPAFCQDLPVRAWQVSERLSVAEIRDGIWVHTSWRKLDSGGNFPANGLLVRYGTELLLIDTAWGTAITKELLEWIDASLKLPVSRAIITHFHEDSMGGMPVLASRGIPSLGLPLTRILGQDEGVPLPESVGDLQIGDAVRVGNVEVFYPGPGHTEDNVVVWVPEARVLFGSCAVRTPQFPGRGNTADANIAAWPGAIRRVQERCPDVEVVVPGHGLPGDASLLSHTILVLQD